VVHKVTHPSVEVDVYSVVLDTISKYHFFFCKRKYIKILMAGVSVNNDKDSSFLSVSQKMKNTSAIVKIPHLSSTRFHGKLLIFL
jgi:hypothetical protein